MRAVLPAVAVVLVAAAVLGNAFASRSSRRPTLMLYRALADRLASGRSTDEVVSPSGVWSTLSERAGSAELGGRDVLAGLEEAIDATSFRPKLAPDVEVKRFELRWGNDYAIIANPRDLVHYRLDPGEAQIVPLMDGTRTVKELVVDRLHGSGELELSAVVELVQQLRVGDFLDTPFVDVTTAVERAIDPASSVRAKARTFVRTLSIDWSGADALVSWLYRNGLRAFFVPWVAAAFGLIAALGLGAFGAVYGSGRFDLGGQAAARDALIILALDYFLTFMHELGHALVLTHFGRRIKSAGFMLYFGSPAFFVESSDALMLDRGQRILQASGGPFAELVIAGAASLVAWALPPSPAAELLYRFALLNYFVIFLNLVPLLELDGYWILADVIQVPDLRPRSLWFIRYDLWRKLRRRERPTTQEVGLALYATLGVAFTVLVVVISIYFWRQVFGSLVFRLWDGGDIGRVLLVVIGLFLAGPVLRGLVALGRFIAARIVAAIQDVRFRLQTRWRVDAAQMIDALPLFSDLPEDVLSDLAGRVRLRRFPAGKPVVRQGERATAFYLVRSGSLEVVEEDPETGDERVLRVLGHGESFGEVALKEATVRSATVRAVKAARLYEIDESTFDRLLVDAVRVPRFAPTVQGIGELRAMSVFSSLEPDQLAELLDHGRWIVVSPDQTLVAEGEPGDAFFAIGSGRFDVQIEGRMVRTLGPGDHFGEIALLIDVPRTASVVSRTPGRVFRLDREGFDAVVAGAFSKAAARRTAADRTWQH